MNKKEFQNTNECINSFHSIKNLIIPAHNISQTNFSINPTTPFYSTKSSSVFYKQQVCFPEIKLYNNKHIPKNRSFYPNLNYDRFYKNKSISKNLKVPKIRLTQNFSCSNFTKNQKYPFKNYLDNYRSIRVGNSKNKKYNNSTRSLILNSVHVPLINNINSFNNTHSKHNISKTNKANLTCLYTNFKSTLINENTKSLRKKSLDYSFKLLPKKMKKYSILKSNSDLCSEKIQNIKKKNYEFNGTNFIPSIENVKDDNHSTNGKFHRLTTGEVRLSEIDFGVKSTFKIKLVKDKDRFQYVVDKNYQEENITDSYFEDKEKYFKNLPAKKSWNKLFETIENNYLKNKINYKKLNKIGDETKSNFYYICKYNNKDDKSIYKYLLNVMYPNISNRSQYNK